jgi:DNA-binding LacI/PurR family transcriptional regulator
VADLANVSTATVSHVINDSRSVESPTRTAVEKAIAKLGYQPNEAARQLARGRHRTPPDVAS